MPGKARGPVESVRFNGIIYRRYPQSLHPSNRAYFQCSVADKRRGYSYLHRDVWIFHGGAIPDGYQVHHKDGNPANNHIDNLECVTPKEHSARHPPGPETLAKLRANLDRQRPKAAAWHGGEVGREWHRQHGRTVFRNLPERDFACERCGGAFRSRKAGARFCSNKCKAAARRASGVDDVPRTCVVCGKTFSVNRYSHVATCGRRCGRRLPGERQASGVQPDG
jgi:predicted nucleic acid-binding Zn ribbon protein